jgi:hypothetical protein
MPLDRRAFLGTLAALAVPAVPAKRYVTVLIPRKYSQADVWWHAGQVVIFRSPTVWRKRENPMAVHLLPAQQKHFIDG